jgi:CheY-like chemotaxis protein
MESRFKKKNPMVLVVDDDDTVFLSVQHFAKRSGLTVGFEYASDAGEAVEKLNQKCFDAALLDVCLPGVTGISLGALVREHDVNIPLAYLTNLDSEAVRTEAITQRAFFLLKIDYFATDEGMEKLLKIINEMVLLNPCIDGGLRVDNHGYPRQLKQTPIELPPVLDQLLQYSKTVKAAASAVA